MNDRTKIIDKIRKCMALGKSPNEHEAAAALRQAQKLMQAHGISEADVGLAEFSYETIVTDYEYGSKKPLVIVAVVQTIERALGVEAVMGGQPDKNSRKLMHTVRYFGPRARVAMATHAHLVVYRACGSAWRRYSSENPSVKEIRGSRASFYYGWCQSVASKIEALMPTEAEAEGIRKKKAEVYGRDLAPAKLGTKTVNSELIAAGADASKDFSLHRPVGQERARLEKL